VTESPEFCPAIGRLIGVVGFGGGVGGVTGGGFGRPKASALEKTSPKVTTWARSNFLLIVKLTMLSCNEN
jgi:hypothetical protein